MVTSAKWFTDASEVLTLFVIPMGGGIPAGVVLAKTRGLQWPMMMAIYLVSDLILAVVFEPLMHLFILATKHSRFLERFLNAYKTSLAKTGFNINSTLGPFSLIMLSFGVDPMTGRAAAKAVGHGFVSGWALAISGDMIFFALIMVSTIWLNNILGNGTWAAVIITVAMFCIPPLIKRWRGQKSNVESLERKTDGTLPKM